MKLPVLFSDRQACLFKRLQGRWTALTAAHAALRRIERVSAGRRELVGRVGLSSTTNVGSLQASVGLGLGSTAEMRKIQAARPGSALCLEAQHVVGKHLGQGQGQVG